MFLTVQAGVYHVDYPTDCGWLKGEMYLCLLHFWLTLHLCCRYARLQSVKGVVAGRLLFVRFVATTGDAMGMNMVSKVFNSFWF